MAPPITQVASGGINPLRYKLLVDNIRAWFTEHPLYDAEGQPIEVPEWTVPRPWPRAGAAEASQGASPRRPSACCRRCRCAASRPRGRPTLEEKKNDIDRAYEYVQLYGLYTECEAIYQVDKLMRDVGRRCDADDQAAFNFDPRCVDWPTYISTIHLPSIVHHSRAKVTPGKNRNDRAARLRRSVLSPDRHVAAFDLENTLISSNVVESYSWLATRRLNMPERIRYVLRTLAEAPTLSAMIDRKDRGDFLRFFYRRYEDAPWSQIDEDSQELLTQLILTKSFPAGLRRVREHRALGHRTILITGALDFAVEGLRPLFDEIVAAKMTVRPDGTYSGELSRCRPPARPAPRSWPTTARAENLKLGGVASPTPTRTSDLPMLECVGFPVAVNPETRLAAIARKRGWLVEHWSKASGAPKTLLPIGPMLAERERRRTFA